MTMIPLRAVARNQSTLSKTLEQLAAEGKKSCSLCMKRRRMIQTRLSMESLKRVSEIRSMVPVMMGRKPSASNLRPRRALICVEQMVRATADVKPLSVGREMKFTRKPSRDSEIC
jgi:hypothetical protein